METRRLIQNNEIKLRKTRTLFVVPGLKAVLSETIDENPERPASDTHIEGLCSTREQTPFGDFIIPDHLRFKDETACFFIWCIFKKLTPLLLIQNWNWIAVNFFNSFRAMKLRILYKTQLAKWKENQRPRYSFLDFTNPKPQLPSSPSP